MKLLELYTNTNGPHRFICVEGVRRNDMDFTSSDINLMLAEALRIIESDDTFDDRIRIYDAHHIYLKRDVTRWVTRETLKSWVEPDKQALAA